jgi:hypothetical protein
MLRVGVLCLVAAALAALLTTGAGHAAGLPSGERQVGQALVEPAFDDMTGGLIYLLTPIHAPFPAKANDRSWEPIYVVVYPSSSTFGDLNCMMSPNNCPDHNGVVDQLARQINPNGLYSNGTKGHDHILHAPGPPGGEFNVNWEIHLILFTDAQASQQRLRTLDDLFGPSGVVTTGKAIDVDLELAFICAVVPARVYARGTPVVGQ